MDIIKVDLNISELTFSRESASDKIFYIFDGELIKSPLSDGCEYHFQLFDSILINGSFVIEENYIKRLEYCEDFLEKDTFLRKFQPPKQATIHCFVKDFYETSYVDFLLKRIASMKIYKDEIDGLIFTKINFPYLPGKSCGILKWKPDYLNTIDFVIVENHRYIRECPELFEKDDFYVFELFTIH